MNFFATKPSGYAANMFAVKMLTAKMIAPKI